MKDNNKFNSEYFDSSDAHFYPKVKEELFNYISAIKGLSFNKE